MAGPIVRSGRVVLSVELADSKINAVPVNKALVEHQKAVSEASKEAVVAIDDLSASYKAQADAEAEVEEATKRAAIVQEEQSEAIRRHTEDSRRAAAAAMEGINNVGEGFFRLGRATVLLGATSEESFQKMVKGLAVVQAGFDLFKGSMQIVRGVTSVIRAMEMAQLANATATVTSSAAMGTSVGVVTRLFAALGPVGAVVAGISAAVGVAATAWHVFAGSQREATKATEEHIAALRKQQEALFDANDRRESSREALENEKFLGMNPDQQIKAIDEKLREIEEIESFAKALGPIAEPHTNQQREAKASAEAEMFDLERRKLELEREKRALVEQRAAGAAKVDPAGAVRDANAEALKQLLREAEQRQQGELLRGQNGGAAGPGVLQGVRDDVEHHASEVADAILSILGELQTGLAKLTGENAKQQRGARRGRGS